VDDTFPFSLSIFHIYHCDPNQKWTKWKRWILSSSNCYPVLIRTAIVQDDALTMLQLSRQIETLYKSISFSIISATGSWKKQRPRGRPFIMYAPGEGGGQNPIRFFYLRNVKKCVQGRGGSMWPKRAFVIKLHEQCIRECCVGIG